MAPLISPDAQHRAILRWFRAVYRWPCGHDIELREERRGDLRCVDCDRTVERRTS